MSLHEASTHYDILELPSDATPQEIREAYVRAKNTFNKDSVALYSLIAPEEREQILKRIEEAYVVLSNPEKRREYDQLFGQLELETKTEENSNPFGTSELGGSVISIDRVPPMEASEFSEEMLVAPSTDITSPERASPPTPPTQPPAPTYTTQAPAPPPAPPIMVERNFSEPAAPKTATTRAKGASLPNLQPSLLKEIAAEQEWHGAFLKKIREAYQISLEEMAATSKISKNYIHAIEEENGGKLPAPVFVRGFVVQIARILKLPSTGVADAYMARYCKDPHA
jgi:hypothetical protein